MAKYVLTDAVKQELMNIPSEILPKDVLSQTKTFPIRSILEGMEQELEPEEIGNMVYNELSQLQMDKFTDVGMRNTNDWAKFVQAKVQSKLKSIINNDVQVEDDLKDDDEENNSSESTPEVVEPEEDLKS